MPEAHPHYPIQPRRQSRPEGDLVLAVLPPFFNHNWLGAGIVRIAHMLTGNGISPRIPRLFETQGCFPESVVMASHRTSALDIELSTRLETIRAIVPTEPDFFNQILDGLLAGPERLFAFSVWRTNVDITLEICRQIKEKRPEASIILGGPEAIERGHELQGLWVDAVVSGSGEDVIVPMVQAFLDGQGGRCRRLASTWVAAEHLDDGGPLAEFQSVSEIGPVDYESIFPLIIEDSQPELPTVLNVGCVYNCGFCTNRLVYPKIGWGSIEACVEEVARLGELWIKAWPDPAKRPRFSVQFCDAAINGNPKQFFELCKSLAERSQPWNTSPGSFYQSANWVVDHRVDETLVECAIAGGFTSLFFGLESGNDRIRKMMRKPGKKAQVWKGLKAANQASQGRLNVSFGTIVGWPTETETEHLETIQFMERIISLEGLSPSCNVSPLLRTASAQDDKLLVEATGAAYGLLWQGDGASGIPSVRARRTMHYAERFRGIMRVDYPLPLELLSRWMMPEEEHGFLDRWFEQLGPVDGPQVNTPEHPSPEIPALEVSSPLHVEPTPAPLPPEKAFDDKKIIALFSVGKVRHDRIKVAVDENKAEVVILRASGDSLLTFVVYPRSVETERNCYFKTRNLDISLRGTEHGADQLAVARRMLPFVAERDGNVELGWYAESEVVLADVSL